MRKICGLSLFGLLIFCANNAFAVFSAYIEDDMKEQEGYRCGTTACDSTIRKDSGVPDAENCETSARGCFRQTGLPNQGTTYGAIYSVTYCTSCKPGYELKTITADSSRVYECSIIYDTCVKSETPPSEPCEGLPCEGYTKSNPKDDPTNVGRQIYCNTSTNKCEYKCKNNYYNAARNKSSTSTIGTYCKTCPTNATCTNGEVKCPKDDYLSRIQTGSYYAFECNNCPSITSYNPHSSLFISGQTSSAIDSTNEVFDTAGAQTTITQCYIPNNAHITTKEGHEYRFKNNCYYDS